MEEQKDCTIIFWDTLSQLPPVRGEIKTQLTSTLGDLRQKIATSCEYNIEKFNIAKENKVLPNEDDSKTLAELNFKIKEVISMSKREGSKPEDFHKEKAAPRVTVGLAPTKPSDSNTNSSKEEETKKVSKDCGICLEEKELEPPIGNCSHRFCAECLQRILTNDFLTKGKSFLEVRCPSTACTETFVKIVKTDTDTSIDDSLFKKYASEETYKKFLSVLKTIPKNPKDPKLSLADFCYKFNDKERLVHAETGEKFHWVNQVHYDLLGDLIIPYIQQRMIDEFKMQEIQLPFKEDLDTLTKNYPDHVRNNVFITPDVYTNKEKLMLLIQGSGAVRAGQWARALCINDSLDVGAIFGYLSKAIKAGFAVIVFNPNLNYQPLNLEDARPKYSDFLIPGKPRLPEPATTKIPFNGNPVEHTVYVWDHIGAKSPAKKLVIVAHSAGGACTMGLLREREKEVLSKLKAVGFTDSVHWVSPNDPPAVAKFIVKNAINWVQSDNPLDTPERSSKGGCPCVSSGHTKHEYTSASAIESVFKFLISKTS